MISELSVAQSFLAQARAHRARIAVWDNDRPWTYAELEATALQFARKIAAATPAPGERVAIVSNPSASTIAAFLGVLLAHRVAVPLSPGWPECRIAGVLHDSGTTIVVVDDEATPLGLLGYARIPLPERIQTNNCAALSGQVELGCLLYTSGSSGEPKGVPSSQRALMSNARNFAQGLGLQPNDRVASFSPLATGQGVASALATLLHGATFCICEPRNHGFLALADWLDATAASAVLMTPTLLREFDTHLQPNRVFPDVRIVRLGSEPARREDFRRFQRRFPHPNAELVNALAATETGVIAQIAFRELPADGGELLPVGRPTEGTSISLRDDQDNEAQAGHTGEIVIRHEGLISGYWGHVSDSTTSSARGFDGPFFRTGDLGRWRSDGNLEFVGRRDLRIKLRGHRIELEEIEAVLARQPGVREAAAAVRTMVGEHEVLTAFVVTPNPHTVSASEMRRHAQLTLPDHMVPNRWQWLDALPRLPGGKVDRRALESFPLTNESESPLAAATDSLVSKLQAIWAEVLQVPFIGPEDDFFVFGGDSLRVMVLVLHVTGTLGFEPPVSAIYQHPTATAFAQYLRSRDLPSAAVHRESSTIVRLNAVQTPNPIFLLPSGDGREAGLALYIGIARALEPEWPLYGLPIAPFDSLEAGAARQLKTIRSRQPRGPYRLIGGCIGGILAYEIAQQLQRNGEIVNLILFDTPFPGPVANCERRLRRLVSGHYSWSNLQIWGRRRLARLRFLRVPDRSAVLASSWAPKKSTIPEDAIEITDLLKSYRPKRFSGRLVLILTEDSDARWSSRGWRNVTPNGAEIHWVPGDHLSVRQNSSELFAKIIRSSLTAELLPQSPTAPNRG